MERYYLLIHWKEQLLLKYAWYPKQSMDSMQSLHGERTVSSINGDKEKLEGHVQKNETGSLSYTIHKNQFKLDKDLNISPEP